MSQTKENNVESIQQIVARTQASYPGWSIKIRKQQCVLMRHILMGLRYNCYREVNNDEKTELIIRIGSLIREMSGESS